MEQEQNISSQKGSTKNIIIISAFLLLIIAIIAVALAKISNHFKSQQTAQNPYSNTTSNTSVTAPVVSPTGVMPNVSAKDTTNTQLDKDLQDAQGNLNKLDGDINNVDQGLNNASQDIPQ